MPLGLLRFIQCIIFGVRAFEPLTKLQLSLSQSLLTQELLGYEGVVSVKQLAQPRNNLNNCFIFLANWVVGQFLKKNEDRWQYVNERACAQR